MSSHGATEEGTRQYGENHRKWLNADKVRLIGELSVSALALGTYLGNFDDQTDRHYEEALSLALQRGCNFIDTAINYRCQRSERIIGHTLNHLIQKKKIKREQIVVATKGGFIPFDGSPPGNLEAFIKKNYVDTGLAPAEEIVSSCHCLHPAFLQNQIDGSLANLGLETVDLYYLHNPETQLAEIGVDSFYEKMGKAFDLLEENVRRGKIQYYGLATWSAFREPLGGAENISLAKLASIALKSGGSSHHLKIIQLPYSFAMLEAVSVHGQKEGEKNVPILPAAASQGISVMTSAPLLQGQILKLPSELTDKMPGDYSLAVKALQFVTSTPSVTSCMVGMKQTKHVEENLAVLGLLNWELPVLQKICDLLTKK